MLRGSHAGPVPGKLTLLHDESRFTISTQEPTALQVDGDSMGEVDAVEFSHMPHALRIVG
jgi:diacylglycerol kinase family enzyme